MNILWVPHASWSFPHRSKLFCRELSGRHSVHVTNVNTYFGASDYLGPGYLKGFFYRRRVDDGIVVHDIPRISPALYSRGLRRLNNRLFLKHVNRIVVREKIDCVVGSYLCPPPECKKLVLDVSDDHAAYWREIRIHEDYAREIDEVHRGYLRRADSVVVMGNVMKERLGFDKARVIPNPVDVERFRTASGNGVRKKYGGRIVGYYQNHDFPERFMVFLDAAEKLSDIKPTFIVAGRGSFLKKGRRLAVERGLDNIVFTGHLPYEAMPEYTAAMDVGLCIFPRLRFLDAAVPLATLEAAAAGRNAVCSRSREVESWGLPGVFLADFNAGDVAEKIRGSLASRPAASDRIMSFDLKKLAAEYERILEG